MTLFARLALRVSGAAPSLQPRATLRFAPALPLPLGLAPVSNSSPSAAATPPLAARPAGANARTTVAVPAPGAPQGPIAPPWPTVVADAAPIRGRSATPPQHDVPMAPPLDPGIPAIAVSSPPMTPADDGGPSAVPVSQNDAPVPPAMAPAEFPAPFARPIAPAPEEGSAGIGAGPDLPVRASPPVLPPAPRRGRPGRSAPPATEAATVVEVRIGAIEVHTPPPAAPTARAESRLMSLDAYLTRGRRR